MYENENPNLPCLSDTDDVLLREAEIKLELAKMFQVLRSPQSDAGEARWLLQTYAETLARYGVDTVRKACKAALDGTLGDRRFRPSPGEMAHWCRQEIESQVHRVDNVEMTRTKYLTQARPSISQERRKEISEMIRGAVAKNAPPSGNKPRRAKDARDDRETAEREKEEAEMALQFGMYQDARPCRASAALMQTFSGYGQRP